MKLVAGRGGGWFLCQHMVVSFHSVILRKAASTVWFVLLTEAVSFDSGICLQLIFDSWRMFLLHKEKVEIVVLNCAQPLTECLLRMINDCIRLS